MASQSYIVIRLVPESPVDGATFSTYLAGLALQVLDANSPSPPSAPLSDLVYASPLTIFQWPGLTGYFSVVSAPTSGSTTYDPPSSGSGSGNYGKKLTFDSTDGISVGSYVFSSDLTATTQAVIASSSGSFLQVTGVTADTVELSGTLQNNVPAGTVAVFFGSSPSADPANAPGLSFPLVTDSPATTLDGQPPTDADPLRILYFADASGVTVGMTVTGSDITDADATTNTPATTVAAVTAVPSSSTTVNAVIVSQALQKGFPSSGESVTFTLNAPYVSFSLEPSNGTPTGNPTTLIFPANGTERSRRRHDAKSATRLVPHRARHDGHQRDFDEGRAFQEPSRALARRPRGDVHVPAEFGDSSAR